MCIGTIIPTPSAHAVKPLWSENTKPSVIVAVNGLIGRDMKMQKWYIRAGVGQPQMKTTNKSVKLNSHNILKSRCTRSHTQFGTKLASNASVATDATPPHFCESGNEGFLLVEALPQSPQNTILCSGNAGKFQRLRDFTNRLNGHQRPSFSASLAAVRELSSRIRSTFALAVCRARISSLAFW